MRCDECGGDRQRIWQVASGKFVCIFCVKPLDFVGYPAWKKQAEEIKRQERLHEQRAGQARKNFHHKEAKHGSV